MSFVTPEMIAAMIDRYRPAETPSLFPPKMAYMPPMVYYRSLFMSY